LISGSQLRDHSVPLKKLTAPAIAALRGQVGPAGPAGAAGPQGAPGGFDPNKVSYVQGPTVSVAPSQVTTLTATCPSGTKAIAGGGYTSLAATGGSLPTASGWALIIVNESSIQLDGLYAFAVCAAP
jgi:hypothetical protein